MFFQLIKNLLGFSPKGPSLETALAQSPVLVDVRTAAEFQSGSVAGAINIPVQELPDRLRELKKDDKTIVVFCRSGSRSAMAKAILEQNGFGSVVNGGPWQTVQQAIKG